MFSDINQVITNLTIKQKRDLVKTLKAVIKEDLQDARNAKVSAKVAKQNALDSKRLDAIAKAEAKIAKLKTLVMRAVQQFYNNLLIEVISKIITSSTSVLL